MKTIGILGGMSASSTILYYQILCNLTQQRLGGLHSPQLLIRSLDFAPIAELQAAGDWDAAGALLNAAALDLERGGAEILLLATNTMHKIADRMMEGVSIPLLHLADATAIRIRKHGTVDGLDGASSGRGTFRRPGLMATRFTMEESFYLDRLRAAGLDPIVPGEKDREEVHRIIYTELCKGVVKKESEETFMAVAERLVQGGADCLILGCTEVGMLLNQQNVSVPVFDTTRVHCEEALRVAIED